MRVFNYFTASCILALTQACYAPLAAADAPPSPFASGDPAKEESLTNLGKYLGYDLANYCTDGKCGQEANPPIATLINLPNIQLTQLSSFIYALGTWLGGSSNPVVPDKQSVIQSSSGPSHVYPNYSQGGQGSSNLVTVAPIIDQKEYQQDPINQAVLNMLITPDSSYCQRDPNAQACQSMSRQTIITSEWAQPADQGAADTGLPVVKFPLPAEIFSKEGAQALLGQLNADSFLMPLMYSKTDLPNKSDNTKGLTANTQAQQAANFVRYVTGLVNPLPVANVNDYAQQYQNSISPPPGKSQLEIQSKAQANLADYLIRLRIYAAQSSVAIGNIYQMMARRMPQAGPEESSAALSEFKMATWRLSDTSKDSNNSQEWLTKIQNGSPATVQKEIAVLLAEINYQMYLTRQQNERMLLTQSIGLLQMARFAAPNPRLDQPQLTP